MSAIRKFYKNWRSRWGKVPTALTLSLVIGLLLVGVTLALGDLDPTTTWNVAPQIKTFPGDRACPAGSTLFQDQFQSVTESPEGTYSASIEIDGILVTVEITTYADNSFDFNIINGVTPQMFVKGDNYLLYQYDPKVSSATNTGPVSYDTGLHDGEPQNEGGTVWKDVSHLDICLIPSFEPLEVTKTAAGTYDRTVEWDLVKNVNEEGNDFTEYIGKAGDKFYPDWLIYVNKTETLDNYKVTGNITITNPNDFPVDFEVTDELDDSTVADVSCPSYTIPANDSVTCTYEALPADDSATLNTAMVTSLTTGVDGDTATASVSFTENLIGYDEGTLTDDRFLSYSETVTDDFSDTLPETFECSTDPGDYTDGQYTETFKNTATLNGNINLEDDASIKLICELDPLDVNKTAAGTYDRTVTWDLVKNVNEEGKDYHEYTGKAGDEFVPDWLLFVDKEEVLGNYKVTGDITITNPAAVTQSVTGVSDMLDDGTVATVDCGTKFPIEIAAGGELVCTYVALPDDDSAASNKATVSAVGNADQTATANVSFTENLIGYDEGTLTDDRFPLYSETVTDDFSDTLPETFECSTDPGDYTDGEYTETFKNTATLNGNINLKDDASIKLICELDPLDVNKTAAGTYDRTVTWDLKKYVNEVGDKSNGYEGHPGSAFPTDWLIFVEKTEVLDNYKVTGDIMITNPAGVTQSVTDVSDVLNDGTVATVDCGAVFPINILAGDTLTCTYTAMPADASATLNTATVSATGNADQTATASVSFTDNLIGYDEGTLTDDRFPSYSETVTDDFSDTLTETFYCPPSRSELYVDGIYTAEVVNTADLNDNIDLQDSAKITIYCEDFGAKSGYKWDDKDADGFWDEGEPVLPDWEVHFINLDDLTQPPIPVYTNALGLYEFKQVLPGVDYAVCEVLQAGYIQTYPFSGDDLISCEQFDGYNYGAYGYLINLQPGEIEKNNDFGNFKPLGCTYTIGYWKTHSIYGPAGPVDPTWDLKDFGDALFFDTGLTWYEMFWTPPAGGNAYIILAKQYMGAWLNINNVDPDKAADPTLVTEEMALAKMLLEFYAEELLIIADDAKFSDNDRALAIELASYLDMYNNGELEGGPPHCD